MRSIKLDVASFPLFKLALSSLTLVLSMNAYSAPESDLLPTLKKVKRQGDLQCGVFPDDPGRSAINANGEWQGFYVDFCKAVAAAVLKNPTYVNYLEVGAKSRFTSLMERKADVVMYSSTWTLSRETKYELSFPAVYLFDGQGFMVRKSSNVNDLDDLNGKTICVTRGTSTHDNLMAMLKRKGLDSKVQFANGDSFFRGSCDAYTADRMNLATNKANRADNPDDYKVLSETISREPIGPMVRNDDYQWQRIVRAVVHATIVAEAKGITSENVTTLKGQYKNSESARLLGSEGNVGAQLGLDGEWAYRVIQAVGNYGEIYNRHFGPDTPIGMERGVNRPWIDGGLLYAPLFK